MGASFLKVPELMMTEEEANQLAVAIRRVSDLYEVPLLDEKTMAWINLGIVGSKIYGPRVIAATVNSKAKKVQSKNSKPVTVINAPDLTVNGGPI